MSSKKTNPSVDLSPEYQEFWVALSQEIYNKYKETILNYDYLRVHTDVDNSETEDITSKEDYIDFVKTKLQ